MDVFYGRLMVEKKSLIRILSQEHSNRRHLYKKNIPRRIRLQARRNLSKVHKQSPEEQHKTFPHSAQEAGTLVLDHKQHRRSHWTSRDRRIVTSASRHNISDPSRPPSCCCLVVCRRGGCPAQAPFSQMRSLLKRPFPTRTADVRGRGRPSPSFNARVLIVTGREKEPVQLCSIVQFRSGTKNKKKT